MIATLGNNNTDVLAVSYNVFLLAGAATLAVIAGFTGLSLANGLSRLPSSKRKAAIARAAAVLGGGVWSTHFVAMLALQLPVDVVYDPVYTLASALIAVLAAGAALLILHFSGRSLGHIVAAGCLMGMGVVAMHYIGMFGMRGCVPVYGVWGYVISSLLSAGICIGALRLAYQRRTLRGLVIGGAIYGIAILAMHFSAMSQTGFLPLETVEATTRMVPNDMLAMLVLVAAFLICGAFLLTTATLGNGAEPVEPTADDVLAPEPPKPEMNGLEPSKATLKLPYEMEGKTFFARIEDIVAVQAQGHYTRLYRVSGPAFCPQPITRVAKELADGPFMRTHRSYLVNLDYVEGFERRKDEGVCLFAPGIDVDPVPVSRANVAATKAALGL